LPERRSSAALPIAAACAAGLLAQALPTGGRAGALDWIVPAALLLPARDRSPAAAAVLLGTGIGALALALGWWIPWTLVRRFDAEPAAAAAVWLLGGLCHVPAGAALGALSSWIGTSERRYAAGVGLGWGVMELSWETACPGFPSWTVLAARQIDTPLAPLAACIGVYGVSAVVAAISAAGLQLAQSRRRGACGAALLLLAGGFASWSQLARTPPASAPAGERIALIQPGTPMPGPRGSAVYQRELLDSLLAQTRALRLPARFVIWPEGALLGAPADEPRLLGEIAALARARGLDLLLGGARREQRDSRVSVYRLRGGDAPRALYDKRRLVPFAEAWPGWAPPGLRESLGRLAPARPPSAGELRAPDLPFELSLCWESAFSATRGLAGAGTLVNLANDGWYDDTPAAGQALVMARWRAAERRAWLARAASTGISAVVAPDGRVHAALERGARGALYAPLVQDSPETPFERAGYTPLCSSLAGVLGLGLRSHSPRPGSQPR
jgi:apolipoprotein N-acyltransferase